MDEFDLIDLVGDLGMGENEHHPHNQYHLHDQFSIPFA
jgi:hypothetical protein